MKRWGIVAMLVTAFGAASACRAPTQMTVRIVTEDGLRCSDLKRVVIIVGPDPGEVDRRSKTEFTSADTRACESETSLGSLVITPDGDRGAVMVIAQVTDAPCSPPDYKDCIVARRSFGFLTHVKEEIPIGLAPDCKSLPCGVLESCHRGGCVSSEVTCDDNGTCTSEADGTAPPSADGGHDSPVDGPQIQPDAARHDAGDDASSDASIDVNTEGGVPPVTKIGCPLPNSGLECNPLQASARICCGTAGDEWACGSQCSSPFIDAQLECTDTAQCPPTLFCCLQQTTGKIASDCRTRADCSGGLLIAQTAAQCPPPMTLSPGPTFGSPPTNFAHCQ